MNIPNELEDKIHLMEQLTEDDITLIVCDCAKEVRRMRDIYGAYPDRANIDEIANAILSRYGLEK